MPERRSSLESFGGYTKACELFDCVAHDVSEHLQDRRLERLVSQQLASADSVCANIEEGYGRQSRKEYTRYLVIARGSARETMGRYGRLGHWIPQTVVSKRTGLCNEIVAILSKTIATLSKSKGTP